MGIVHHDGYLLVFSLDLGISQLLGFRLSLCVSGLGTLANPTNLWLLYAGISLLFWWLAVRLRGNAVVNFCLFGGLWGMITHLFAVSIGIVTKPPVLQGAAPAATVIFAIFEFMLYWCIILTIAVLLHHVWRELRHVSV